MKKTPTVYELDNLQRYLNDEPTMANIEDDKWAPARPLGFFSIWRRLHCTYLAFTGKCDLIRWPGNQ